jgi:enediyne biosynthesis protein E7
VTTETSFKAPPLAREEFDLSTDAETLRRVQEYHRAFGDIVQVNSPKYGPTFVVFEPEYTRQILVTHASRYRKGRGFDRVRLLLGNGIFVSDGEIWKRQRRIVQPCFARQRLLRTLADTQSCHDELEASWRNRAERGQTVDVLIETSQLALSVICRATFGDRIRRIEELCGENPFRILVDDQTRDLRFVKRFWNLRPIVTEAAAMKTESRDDFMSTILDARGDDQKDFAKSREFVDEIMTLIVAGHETTAATLVWIWYLLAKHPESYARVRAERASRFADGLGVASGATVRAVDQVILEALRLYPPGWLLSRTVVQADALGPYFLPVASEVFLCPYVVHRRVDCWSEPDAFRPQRFEECPRAAAFIPFALGPRRCIGEHMALATARRHIFSMATQFQLDLVAPAELEIDVGVNLRPKGPVKMTIKAL